jgi:hypothetical protein
VTGGGVLVVVAGAVAEESGLLLSMAGRHP